MTPPLPSVLTPQQPEEQDSRVGDSQYAKPLATAATAVAGSDRGRA